MSETSAVNDQLDPHLYKARQLLQHGQKPKASIKEALLSSVAFAVAALMLVVAIVMGPGWEAPQYINNQATVNVVPGPKAMVVQAPTASFELSAAPLPTDGVNEAVPLSEDELSAGEGTKP